jgi:hypothetical protein
VALVKVLVFGSRSFTNRDVIHWDLDTLALDGDRVVVINGFAHGADRMADEWASAHDKGQPWRFAPAWPFCDLLHPSARCPDDGGRHRKVNRAGVEFCPLAGHRRNQEMADALPDLAFGYIDKPLAKSRGSADMHDRCEAVGVPVAVYGGDQLSLHRPGLVLP